MISSTVIIIFSTAYFASKAFGQDDDVCLSVRRSPEPEVVQGRPGKQGAHGPIGPQGLPGPQGLQGTQGNCTCDLSEVLLLREKLNRVTGQLEMNNRTINELKAYSCFSLAEQGWYNPGNRYQYQRSTSEQNWQESRQLCQTKGGDLAHIGIKDLNIRSKVFTALLGPRGEDAWIGLSDIQTEGTFRWLDGTVATPESVNWAPHEPSDGGGGNEDCVHLNWQHPNHPANSANDFYCSQNAYALCEKPVALCD